MGPRWCQGRKKGRSRFQVDPRWNSGGASLEPLLSMLTLWGWMGNKVLIEALDGNPSRDLK